ncbi:hypothetical protein MTO98_07340 [Mucilaginibacter sp. SMC90]|uniref:hypothetical protein n=1 Tax=Mucilaginibacter sp. SMC90 TaxID=2929803 RepID=UPI001FB1A702|nr:hypothetical protein [Mucilaginibacter sp. SMC90]UOE50890.1 hypothetical protein MTO98_07340 [Mucilaginibacter sp. SMC90]
MGEYVKYNGHTIKIGTCEDMYYTDYGRYIEALREGQLMLIEGNADPQVYAMPGTGLRFRFPFPDEDIKTLGKLGKNDYERGLLITIERGLNFATEDFPPVLGKYIVESHTQPGLMRQLRMLNPNNVLKLVDIEIVQQKPVLMDGNFYLLLIYRCPYSDERWRIEDKETAEHIASQIRQRYLLTAENEDSKDFWQKLIDRILIGYEPGADY